MAQQATLTVIINAPLDQVFDDLADPATHPEWATEFFDGPAAPSPQDGEVAVVVPMMGGPARLRVHGDRAAAALDVYLAPGDAPFGPGLPVRLVEGADGIEVRWTLTRAPQMDDAAWAAGCASMQRELDGLRARHEG